MVSKENKWPYVFNCCNSIIGVSVLAMPFVMKQCGIFLGTMMIFVSGLMTRISCYLLIKGAFLARRRSYESFAAHVYGPAGKLLAEVVSILFIMSTLMAFFVVIGDIGPDVIATWLGRANTQQIRVSIMMIIALCIVLPLSLLRNMESLSAISGLAVVFYGLFVIRMFLYCLPKLITWSWIGEVNFWRTAGFLQCLPIISLSLACQMTVFAIADAMSDSSPAMMDEVVTGAVNICSVVYILVGIFGYITFSDAAIGGDILVLFDSSSFLTQIIKLMFMLSVAVSFPLMIFPCRAAVYTLLFRPAPPSSYDLTVDILPDIPFRGITIFLVLSNLVVAIMVPNVELILGLSGSLVGSVVCFVIPAALFIGIAPKHLYYTKIASQVLLLVGMFILIVCTYVTLKNADTGGHVDHHGHQSTKPGPVPPDQPVVIPAVPVKHEEDLAKRQEPPLPEDKNRLNEVDRGKAAVNAVDDRVVDAQRRDPGRPVDVKQQRKKKPPTSEPLVAQQEHKEIIQQLKEQRKEQAKLISEQKEIIKQLKEHKEEHIKADHEKIVDKKPIEAAAPVVAPQTGNISGGQKQQGSADVVPEKLQQPVGGNPPNQAVDTKHVPGAPQEVPAAGKAAVESAAAMKPAPVVAASGTVAPQPVQQVNVPQSDQGQQAPEGQPAAADLGEKMPKADSVVKRSVDNMEPGSNANAKAQENAASAKGPAGDVPEQRQKPQADTKPNAVVDKKPDERRGEGLDSQPGGPGVGKSNQIDNSRLLTMTLAPQGGENAIKSLSEQPIKATDAPKAESADRVANLISKDRNDQPDVAGPAVPQSNNAADNSNPSGVTLSAAKVVNQRVDQVNGGAELKTDQPAAAPVNGGIAAGDAAPRVSLTSVIVPKPDERVAHLEARRR